MEIPEGWAVSSGGEIFKWSSGKNLPKDKQTIGEFPVYGGNGIAGAHSDFLSDAPTLVIGRVGANCGNVFATGGKSWITDNAIFATTMPGELNLEYMRLAFQDAGLNSIAGGSGQPFINQQTLNNLTLLIPPKAEQARIVKAIESLQERSSRTRALLAEVKPLIAQLRQSVLRSAFSGRLTADWRATQNTLTVFEAEAAKEQTAPAYKAGTAASAAPTEAAESATDTTNKTDPQTQPPQTHTNGSPQSADTKYETATELLQRIRTERRQKWEAAQLAAFEAKGKKPSKGWQNKYKEPERVDESELPELPNGWCWIFLPEVGYMNRGKSRHRPRNAEHLYGGSHPFVQTGDIANSEGYVTTHTQTYSEEGLKQSRLWPEGTVCITIAANIASSAVLTYPACFPDSVVGVVPDSEVCSSEYIEFFIRTAKEDLDRFAPSTAQKNINLGTLSNLAIPIPPRQESEEIVRLLIEAMDMAKSICNVNKTIEASLTQLDQSILSKAFRGELVPQDPNDEPASELLARISATREAEALKTKVSKKKAACKKNKQHPTKKTH